MYLSYIFYNVQTFCTILLAIYAVIGDWLVYHSNLPLYKAIFDNATHSIIGGLTWLIVCLKTRNSSSSFRFIEVILCATMASIIDLDHFIAARSIHLKDATNLQGRPILHCSTVPLALTGVLLFIAKWQSSVHIHHFAWILFAAFVSHHIRDATRRGFWFYQIGSTKPIPYVLYVILTMILPHAISLILIHSDIYVRNESSDLGLLNI